MQGRLCGDELSQKKLIDYRNTPYSSEYDRRYVVASFSFKAVPVRILIHESHSPGISPCFYVDIVAYGDLKIHTHIPVEHECDIFFDGFRNCTQYYFKKITEVLSFINRCLEFFGQKPIEKLEQKITRKFYKIINPKGHHGLIYKPGVNVDPLLWHPHGDCQPGGIYFSDKRNILSFLSYGLYIAQCTPIGDVYENPGYPRKWKAHSVKLGQFRPLNKKSTWDWIKTQGISIDTDVIIYVKSIYPNVGV